MISNDRRRRILSGIAGGLAAMGLALYAGIVVAAGFDLAHSPMYPIALMAVPFGIALLVLRSRPRAGRVVTGVFAAGLSLFLTATTVEGAWTGWWADTVTVVVGLPLAVAALVVALLPGTSRRTARVDDAAAPSR
jgi:hypothetical protein